MAPAAAATKLKPDEDPLGIRAVLLGPPGSGKGTQVCGLIDLWPSLSHIITNSEYLIITYVSLRLIIINT